MVKDKQEKFNSVSPDMKLEQTIQRASKDPGGIIGERWKETYVTEWNLVFHETHLIDYLFQNLTLSKIRGGQDTKITNSLEHQRVKNSMKWCSKQLIWFHLWETSSLYNIQYHRSEICLHSRTFQLLYLKRFLIACQMVQKDTKFSTGSNSLNSQKKVSEVIHIRSSYHPYLYIHHYRHDLWKAKTQRKILSKVDCCITGKLTLQKETEANCEISWSMTWWKETCSMMVTLWSNTRNQRLSERYRTSCLNNPFCMTWV